MTTRKFNMHPKCKGNAHIAQFKEQTSPVYTFLSRPMLDLFRCRSNYKFTALGTKDTVISDDLCKDFAHKPTLIGKIVETLPDLKAIHYTASAEATGNGKAADEIISIFPYNRYQKNINWNTKIGDISISQKISGIPVAIDTAIRVLAVTRTRTDWLGETSRDWVIFSKQTGGKKRCANTNELRDIANIQNNDAPTLGFPYWADSYVNGLSQPVLKIPLLFKYDGVADGNSITVKAGKQWIAAEYDSEPREIIIIADKLPEAGESINIQIVDEAKHKASYDVTIPGM